ncbi:hypothetical protein KCM76_13105 [Zooshikella marina]|uniref:hypothetical protein n=1 Tax=Zooshikella ganghwensis TaxID=202772 RepID=UPI001BB00FDE|nr:hypothetical protein [Zooshikella ganghwensis]MBU2706926.1 hypothetical protein [Zooshikella ganghwensis]
MKIKKYNFIQAMVLTAGVSLASTASFATEIPGIDNDNIPLGTAYHSKKGGFYGFQAVNGDIDESYGNTESEIRFAVDLGYKQLLDMVNGSVDVGVKVNAVSVDAGGEYATENAADEYTGTYTFYLNSKPKKRLLVPVNNQGYQPTAAALELADESPGNRFEELGDEFVTAIEYGSYLLINMKIEYRSAKDKKNIGGYLKVDAMGVVNVSGDLNLLDEATKNSVKISITAKQVGGDPLRLANIIPDGLMKCSLANPTPCFNLFKEAVVYLKTDYINQLNGLDKYNPVKLYTQQYKYSGPALNVLLPQTGYEDVEYLTKLSVKRMSDRWVKSMLDKRRAENILNYYSATLNSEDKATIKDIEIKARFNAYSYASAVSYCQKNPLGSYCREREQMINASSIRTYDDSKLNLSSL